MNNRKILKSSRRDFLKQNAVTSVGLFAVGGVISCRNGRSEPVEMKSGQENIRNIAGMTPEQLLEKYRKELFDNFIPSMTTYAIDHEYGGVMCSLDIRTGQLENYNKTAWFVGRGMWLYSFLYNNLDKKPEYLEIARKSKDLLLKMQPSDNSFWPRNFTREGQPLTGPGDIYGSLFVAEGLFEYAKASGEKQYRETAKKIIHDCVACYDQPDYIYEVNYLRNVPLIKGVRVLGHWMILLSLSTQMLKHEPDEELEKLTERCVDAIMKYHINKDYGLTNEFLNHDLTLPENEYAQLSVIGHGLETMAFVMFEAARRKDKELFRITEPVFKKHVDVAADHLYGGYFHTLQHADSYTWTLGKSLWCQQEVLSGTLFLIEHTGDEWAKRHFERAHNYSYEKFYNPANKFWHSGGDRKMTNPNINLMEHYHHARELMLGIMSLERMIKRGGIISGLFK
ncbi:MAG: AGE family epimerase/isomerase [Bacteroidales bacterium]|nr:AGE family epimerase/isomerase [Bacteroidales bacterium]